jgi:cytochrome P450
VSLIDEYDALPASDAPGHIGLSLHWLQTDWRGLFADLRERRPILDLPLFLVVTRWSDVIDVLARPGTFNVAYEPRTDPSVGPFMLARDDSELNWNDKSVMRALLRQQDLPAIRDMAGGTAADSLAQAEKASSIDITATLSRGTKVSAGRAVAAAVGSAMFDPDVFDDPNAFRERPAHSYLHTGFRQHECLGQHVAFAVVPEVIRHISMLPGIHLLKGDAGRLDMGGGPFPEHFVLGLTRATGVG